METLTNRHGNTHNGVTPPPLQQRPRPTQDPTAVEIVAYADGSDEPVFWLRTTHPETFAVGDHVSGSGKRYVITRRTHAAYGGHHTIDLDVNAAFT